MDLHLVETNPRLMSVFPFINFKLLLATPEFIDSRVKVGRRVLRVGEAVLGELHIL